MREGIDKIVKSKSRTFLAFCFSFILGVGIFSWSLENKWALYLYSFIFIIVLFIIWFWQNKRYRFILICLLFFCGGALRFLWSMPDCSNPKNICYFNGERKEIIGWIGAEPAREISQTKYILKTDFGKILLTMSLEPSFDYGDELKLSCNLHAPKDQIDSSFSYRQYLAKDNIYSICSGPKILEVKKSVRGNMFMNKILNLKNIIQERVDLLWPEPESTLVGGILYGSRSGFSEDLKDNFNRAGITHIVAVSGYNVTIIAEWLLVGFIFIGLWRKQAFWGVVVMIFLFVIFTGASASVVRAGFMGVLVLIAGQMGRMSRIGNVLAATAGVMILLNPFILIWDAGFQLSFLATLGLVYISPILSHYCHSRVIVRLWREGGNPGVDQPLDPGSPSGMTGEERKDWWRHIFCNEVLISTMSAIIATLPFMLFVFGRLSIVAPVVNVLILWVIPWLMLLGFLAVIISFIFYPAAQVVAWIAGLGLKYVIILAEWFGGKNWSAFELNLPWWGMIILYLMIIRYIITYETKNKNTSS